MQVTVDATAYQISGPGPATASQIINLELVTTLYQLHQSVWKILEEYPDAVTEIIFDAVEVKIYISTFMFLFKKEERNYKLQTFGLIIGLAYKESYA